MKKEEDWNPFLKKIKPPSMDELAPVACPKCGKPLQKQLSRFGTFIGCTGYNDEPKCDYKRSLNGAAQVGSDPVLIGNDTETGKEKKPKGG